MTRTAKAFAPAAISSFFAIHDTQRRESIKDFEKIGAVGGGFGLQLGVHTKVTVEESQKNNIAIFINKKQAENAKTTLHVVKALLEKKGEKYDVTVEHDIEVPVGSGFGTSAGGALTSGLALAEVLEIPLTFNQIGKIAHVAEIVCQTGLGTVSSLTQSGGCVLVTKPGAPGTCQIDRIPISLKLALVIGHVQSVSKKPVLSSLKRKKEINNAGRATLQAILAKPTLQNFLDCCWSFSQNAGFATPKVRALVSAAKKAGAIGAAQNMIGETVHAVVHEENVDCVAETFKHILPSKQVLISKIDFQGVRLVK